MATLFYRQRKTADYKGFKKARGRVLPALTSSKWETKL